MKSEKLAGTYNRIYTHTVCSLMINNFTNSSWNNFLILPHIFCNSGQLRFLNYSTIQTWKWRFICTCVLIQLKGKVFFQQKHFPCHLLQFAVIIYLDPADCTVWLYCLKMCIKNCTTSNTPHSQAPAILQKPAYVLIMFKDCNLHVSDTM